MKSEDIQINLQVISSTKIQTRKPWSKILWLGRENESLMLMRKNRLKKINPQTGKSKRVLPCSLKDCIYLTSTKSGEFLIGMLENGSVFRWCKDTNTVTQLNSDESLTSQLKWNANKKSFDNIKKFTLYASDTGKRVIVVLQEISVKIFLWESINWNQYEYLSQVSSEQNLIDYGIWMSIETNEYLPTVGESFKYGWDFVFSSVIPCGMSELCLGAFVQTTNEAVQLNILNTKINISQKYLDNIPICFWKNRSVPFGNLNHSTDNLTKTLKSSIIRWSCNGNFLVVVVNVKHREIGDSVIFATRDLRKWTFTNLPEDFSDRRHHRWVCDVDWTVNDLFVVLINRLGSVCLIPRFGEPVAIATYGCSMDLPMRKFLNIHPFIYVKSVPVVNDESDDFSVVTLSTDILRQRFSITAHPRLPYFLCSDGYIITCLRLPDEAAEMYSFVGIYIKHIHRLRKIVKRAKFVCEIEADVSESEEIHGLTTVGHSTFKSEKDLFIQPWNEFSPENSDEDSSQLDRALFRSSLVGDHDSGTILLGSHSYKNARLQKPLVDDSEALARNVGYVWNLMVTDDSQWTVEKENRALLVAEELIKVCSIYFLKSQSFNEFKEVSQFIQNWFFTSCCGIVNKCLLVIIFRTFEVLYCKLLRHGTRLPPSNVAWELVRLLLFVEDLLGNQSEEAIENVTELTTINRTMPLWKKLGNWMKQAKIEDINMKWLITNKLLCLGKHNHFPKAHTRNKMLSGSRILLIAPREWKAVTEMWKTEAESLIQCRLTKATSKKLSHRLHAILYALLASYQLKGTTSYIFWLLSLLKTDFHHVIKKVIHSYAYFLASFVMGYDLFIYPYHNPHRLTSHITPNHRLIKIKRQLFDTKINQDNTVAKHWTHNEAISLFLYLGDFSSAYEISKRLGDWKSSIIILFAQYFTSNLRNSEELLCDILTYNAVLMIDDCFIVSSKEFIFFKKLLTTAAFCQINIIRPIFTYALSRLLDKIFVENLSLMVPDFIYLPRPAFYCSQLVADEESLKFEGSEENWGENIAESVQQLMTIFQAGNFLIPCALSYLTFLRNSINEVMKIKNVKNYEWLLEKTYEKLSKTGIKMDDEIVNNIFRNYLTACFFLHARDKMNTCQRKIRAENFDENYKNRLKSKDKACLDTLTWISLLLPFSEVANWNLDLYHLMISTALEAPCDRRTSYLIAKIFPDARQIPVEIQQRLKSVFRLWSNTNIRTASNRKHPSRKMSKNLSCIYEEQCQEIREFITKLQQNLGDFEKDISFVDDFEWKLRRFEIDENYFQFLKIFLEISLAQHLNPVDGDEQLKNLVPLVPSNKRRIYEVNCVFDISETKSSITFEQQLADDAAELLNLVTNCDDSSPRKQSNEIENYSSQYQQKYKFLNKKSCLQYISERKELDSIFSPENEEIRRTLLWLLHWSKQNPTTKKKLRLTLKQVWNAIQVHKSSKCTIFRTPVDVLTSVTESVSPKLQFEDDVSNISLNAASLESEKSKDVFETTESFICKSPSESFGLDLESLNDESDHTFNFVDSSKNEFVTDAVFGLDLESLNRETDDQTTASITSGWSIARDDTSPTDFDSLETDSSPAENIEIISVEKESLLKSPETSDVSSVKQPENKIPESPILEKVEEIFLRKKPHIPPLIQFDDDKFDGFRVNRHYNRRPFLSKEELDQLSLKWIKKTKFNSNDKLKESRKLVILTLPEENLLERSNELLNRDTQTDQKEANNWKSLTVSKSIQTLAPLTKNVSVSANAVAKKKENKHLVLENLTPVNLQPHFKEVKEKSTAATQTQTTQNKEDGKKSEELTQAIVSTTTKIKEAEEMCIIREENEEYDNETCKNVPNEIINNEDVDNFTSVQRINENQNLNIPKSENVKQSTLEEDGSLYMEKDNNFNLQKVTGENVDLRKDFNIDQFKKRLQQLQAEGVLECEVLNVTKVKPPNDLPKPNRVRFCDDEILSPDVEEETSTEEVKFLAKSLDNVSKERELNRLKLQSKHFKQRKEDTIKFLDEIMEDRQRKQSPKITTKNPDFRKNDRPMKFNSKVQVKAEGNSEPKKEITFRSGIGADDQLMEQEDTQFLDISDSFSEESSDESLLDNVQ